MTPEFGRLLVHRQQVNRSIESISVNIYFLYYTYIDDGGKRQKFGMSDATSSPQVALFMFDGGEGGSIFYQKKLTYWNVSQSRMQNVLFMLLGSIQLNSKKWCLVQEEKKRGGGMRQCYQRCPFMPRRLSLVLCFVLFRHERPQPVAVPRVRSNNGRACFQMAPQFILIQQQRFSLP